MSPGEQGHKWFTSWLPLAVQAGPFLTVGLGIIMVISLYWMNSWLTVCVERNQAMQTQLVSQQKEFHTEMLVHMANCAKGAK